MNEYLKIYLEFASDNIYGFIPILAIVYGIFFLVKKLFSRFPDPLIFVVLTFFIGLFTLPSLPRYFFEEETIERYKNRSEWRLVNITRNGAIIEPLTWFNAPIGHFNFVTPIPNALYDFNSGSHSFLLETVNFERGVTKEIASVDCASKKIIYASRDGEFLPFLDVWGNDTGYKYRTKDYQEMDKYNFPYEDYDYKTYCQTDYSNNYKIFRCKRLALRGVETLTPEILSSTNTQCVEQHDTPVDFDKLREILNRKNN
jgi:hypothetical protein